MRRVAPLLQLVILSVLTLTANMVAAGEAATHLAEAVRYRTISHQDRSKLDQSTFLAFHQFLRDTYPQSFSRLDVEVVNELSLMLTWRGSNTEAQPILFTAHMDVVPIEPGTEDEWTHPGFEGVIDNGIVYGRGTLDDKVGVISLLEATERLLAEGFQPRRTVVFAFGHDEEVSGRQGAAKIAARMRERGLYFAWMVDEGGVIVSDSVQTPGRPLALINVAEKTYYTLKLTARGEGGHSSMPPRHSSIGKLAAALARIENNPFKARLEEPVRTMLERLAPYADFPNSLAFSNLWLSSPLVLREMQKSLDTNAMVRTTTAVTMFNGGVKENVIPQEAVAYVNFRLLPGDTVAQVKTRIEELVKDPDITVEPTIPDPRTAPPAAIDGPGFVTIAESINAVYPDAVVVPALLNGATDTRHYIDLADDHYRFHGVLVSLRDSSGIHGTDEKVSVKSFEQTVNVAVQMLRRGAR